MSLLTSLAAPLPDWDLHSRSTGAAEGPAAPDKAD